MSMSDYFKDKYPQLFGDRMIGFECGHGWKQIIEDAFEKIKGTPVKIIQVKEKFGGLRIYSENSDDDISGTLHAAEEESFKTCEGCGTKNDVSTEGSWLKTLCSTCRSKKHWWMDEEETRDEQLEDEFFEAINNMPQVDASEFETKEFELAPQGKINALDGYVNMILKVLGHEEALVTDESKIFDFLFSEPSRLVDVSKELGIEVTMNDYLIDIAARLKLKEKSDVSNA